MADARRAMSDTDPERSMERPQAQPLPRDLVSGALKFARRATRHGVRAAIAFVVGLAVTGGITALKPKHYLSEAVLYYQEGFQWDLQGEGTRRAGQRLREVVFARSRLGQIIEELDLFPKLVAAGKLDDAIDEMRRRTTFRVNEGDTFTVAYVGESPAEAQRVAATLTQSLIADNARLKSGQIELAKSFLDDQRKRREDQLRQKEAALARFLAEHPEVVQAGLASPAGVAPPIAISVPAAPQEAPSPPPAPRNDARAELVAAERQASANLAAARRELATQRERFTERHPSVAAAQALVTAAEAAHRRAADALAAAPVPAEERPRVQRAPRPAAPPRIRVSTLEEHARLTRELAEERDRYQQLDARQFVASMTASSFAGGHSAQISVVDPAYLPARPTGLRTTVLLAAGVAASLGLALLTALVLALLDDRVYDRHDVERWTAAQVLTVVSRLGPGAREPGRGGEAEASPGGEEVARSPRLPAGRREGRHLALSAPADPPSPPGAAAAQRPSQALVALSGSASGVAAPIVEVPPPAADGDGAPAGEATGLDARAVLLRAPDSAAAAAFRILRHRLAERGGPRCILVTSPLPGDGKTTCAVNLALALSEAGRASVLLLDANFRNPALGAMLGPAAYARRGLAGAQDGLWSAVERVTPWLDFAALPDGTATAYVDGLSMRVRLEALAALDYDYVVLDGPPVLGSADVNVLQESASAVLVTMWARRSEASSYRRAVEQIGARKVLGVVLLGS